MRIGLWLVYVGNGEQSDVRVENTEAIKVMCIYDTDTTERAKFCDTVIV